MARWCRGHALHTLPAARCGAYSEATGPSTRGELVSRLGANALGEVLVPGRVPDCYLGLRLDPAGGTGAAGVSGVAAAVVAGWRRGALRARRMGPLTGQEPLALERPAMSYVRAQLVTGCRSS